MRKLERMDNKDQVSEANNSLNIRSKGGVT